MMHWLRAFYKRICLRLGRDWTQEGQDIWRQELIDSYGDGADEELFCIPSQGSGSYLTRTLIERCLSDSIPVIRYEQTDEFNEKDDEYRQSVVHDWCEDILKPVLVTADPKRQTVLGEDFARSGDLTVLLPLQETIQADWHALFSLELRNMPFRQQEQILFYIIDSLPKFHHASLDARGNGQYLAEVAMQRYGKEKISQVMLSETWYRENMPRYKAAFEDKTILLPKDADVIKDNQAFKLIKGVAKLPATKNTGKDQKKRHGDTGIAGVMAIHAAVQEGGEEWSFMPISRAQPKSTALRGF